MSGSVRQGIAGSLALLLHAALFSMGLTWVGWNSDPARHGWISVELTSQRRAGSTDALRTRTPHGRSIRKVSDLLASSISETASHVAEGGAERPGLPENAAAPPGIPAAVLLGGARPGYPFISRKLGEEGDVVLTVLVTPEGRAREVSLKTSSGHERLDLAAASFAREARYQAGRDEAVRELRVHFGLE